MHACSVNVLRKNSGKNCRCKVLENKGKVWLVGAGPSDGGLMTIKGREALRNADVVVYDSLLGNEVLMMIPDSAEMINAGKRASRHTKPQHETNRILLEEALKGKRVVRLKGGDPFLFGRGGEELELLSENNIEYEVVPGITSAIAVCAYAGIPVTHRDFCSSVHIITAHAREGEEVSADFESLVKLGGTLIFMMGVSSLEFICENLLAAGMDPQMPAAVLQDGTSARQKNVISVLSSLVQKAAEEKAASPAVIVVGKVCSLAEKLSWAEKRPLGRTRVIVTRPAVSSGKLASLLREYGAEAIEYPFIETSETEDTSAVRKALHGISEYSWIVCTSPNGVNCLLDKLIANDIDIRSIKGRTAAVGPITAEAFRKRGIKADFVSEEANADALGQSLSELINQDDRILIARASYTDNSLFSQLAEKSAVCDDIAVYETKSISRTVPGISDILKSGADFITFSSASAVRGFVRACPDLPEQLPPAVCIGEKTAAEAAKHGFITEISDDVSMKSMAEKIIFLSSEKRGKYGSS